MRKVAVFTLIFLFSFSVKAGGPPVYGKKNPKCDPTPEQKCRMRHGRWKDGICIKVRTKWRTRWRKRRRKLAKKNPLQDFELRCYRQGGEWRDSMCYPQYPQKKEKPEMLLPPAPPPAPAPAPVVHVNQQVNESRKEKEQEKENKEIKPESPPVILKKEEPKKWWFVGPGAFALGYFMSDQKQFLSGVSGKLAFALNDRFRVSGTVGYSFWQENNLLLGASFDVRVWSSLFASFSLDTLWGGFDDFKVNRRTWLLGVGPSYWFGDRADITLRVVFGNKNEVGTCDTYGHFVGGAILSSNFYF